MACGLAGLLLVILSLLWLLSRVLEGWTLIHLHERPIFYLTIILFIAGLQFLSTGLLAELVVANANRRLPAFSIRDTINTNEEEL
jgi:uncharacterized oligopeptide transporter (OPT) family protein